MKITNCDKIQGSHHLFYLILLSPSIGLSKHVHAYKWLSNICITMVVIYV